MTDPEPRIFNPASGRWVLIRGKIGRALQSESKSESKQRQRVSARPATKAKSAKSDLTAAARPLATVSAEDAAKLSNPTGTLSRIVSQISRPEEDPGGERKRTVYPKGPSSLALRNAHAKWTHAEFLKSIRYLRG